MNAPAQVLAGSTRMKAGSLGVRPDAVTVVIRPVEGSLIMARDRLRADAAA